MSNASAQNAKIRRPPRRLRRSSAAVRTAAASGGSAESRAPRELIANVVISSVMTSHNSCSVVLIPRSRRAGSSVEKAAKARPLCTAKSGPAPNMMRELNRKRGLAGRFAGNAYTPAFASTKRAAVRYALSNCDHACASDRQTPRPFVDLKVRKPRLTSHVENTARQSWALHPRPGVASGVCGRKLPRIPNPEARRVASSAPRRNRKTPNAQRGACVCESAGLRAVRRLGTAGTWRRGADCRIVGYGARHGARGPGL